MVEEDRNMFTRMREHLVHILKRLLPNSRKQPMANLVSKTALAHIRKTDHMYKDWLELLVVCAEYDFKTLMFMAEVARGIKSKFF